MTKAPYQPSTNQGKTNLILAHNNLVMHLKMVLQQAISLISIGVTGFSTFGTIVSIVAFI